MYLYFNKKGQLKEIINDEGLRQGNYGVNKMYIYIEDLNYSAIDAGFLLPSSAIAGPARYDTFTDPQYIPFDAKRDLLFFKYNKLYSFLVIDLEADQNGNSPLDEAGVVHCEFAAVLSNGSQLMLGDVNFNVEASAVANQKQVASQEYLSLSDYTFLKHINSYQPILPLSLVPYTGAASNLDLGSHELSANKINVGNLTIEQTELNAFQIGGNYQDTLNLSFSEVDINGEKVITENDLSSYVTYTAGNDIDMENYDIKDINELNFSNGGYINIDNSNNMNIVTSNGAIILSPDTGAYIDNNSSNDNLIATQGWIQDQGYLTEHQSLTGLVPYTGATDSLNLGTHELDAGSIVITPDPTDVLTSTVIRNTGIQYVRHPNNVFKNATFSFPDVTGNKTLATTDDLSGYVPYSGATQNVNIEGHDFWADDIYSQGNLVATKNDLPKKGVIGTFNTNSFTNTGSNYVLNDIPLSGFISGSDLLIITWGGCFAICPIPVSGPGRVAAALWNSNGESQVVRIKYELKSNNTLLDISLAGGFIPPSNFDGYIINYKIV